MATKKATTKKDLEKKLANLEAQLAKLTSQLDEKIGTQTTTSAAKPKGTLPKGMTASKPAPPPPAETKGTLPKGTLPKGMTASKPAPPPPAETKGTLPKGTLPKGMTASKPAPPPPAETKGTLPKGTLPKGLTASKPAPPPPAETKGTLPKGTLPKGMTPPPAETKPKLSDENTTSNLGSQQDAWKNVPMKDWNEYKKHTTGYVPENNRAWANRHALRGTSKSGDWNMQKVNVTGFTAASNQYFATRQRMAFHPVGKNFNGYNITIPEGDAQTQVQEMPPPKAKRGTLPKGF